MAFDVDASLIRLLAELMGETNLTEIEIAEGEKSLRVTRAAPQMAATVVSQAMPQMMPVMATTAQAAPEAAAGPAYKDADILKSPMVGTAYLSPEPGKPAFVKVGDTVSTDTTIMIIEAMKVMNPIRAHKAGTIKAIMISDAQPVEFAEALVVIE